MPVFCNSCIILTPDPSLAPLLKFDRKWLGVAGGVRYPYRRRHSIDRYQFFNGTRPNQIVYLSPFAICDRSLVKILRLFFYRTEISSWNDYIRVGLLYWVDRAVLLIIETSCIVKYVHWQFSKQCWIKIYCRMQLECLQYILFSKRTETGICIEGYKSVSLKHHKAHWPLMIRIVKYKTSLL